MTKIENIILDREEKYDPKEFDIWCFKHVDDIVEGVKLDLGNMTSCYPFEVNGIKWRSSEELYLCGEFSNNTPEHFAIQHELCATKSPYASKRFIKSKYKRQVRGDFSSFRTQWMLWVVWQKCLGNPSFRLKLLSIPDNILLVEETTTDTGGSATVWGCKNSELILKRKQKEKELNEKYADLTAKERKLRINIELNAIRNVGIFTGMNNIGKILMICRHCLIHNAEPSIDYALLESKNIYIFGEPIRFR